MPRLSLFETTWAVLAICDRIRDLTPDVEGRRIHQIAIKIARMFNELIDSQAWIIDTISSHRIVDDDCLLYRAPSGKIQLIFPHSIIDIWSPNGHDSVALTEDRLQQSENQLKQFPVERRARIRAAIATFE